MSIMLQALFCVLVLAIIYASYIHNTEYYQKIFALFPDFTRAWQFTNPEYVKIQVLVHRDHAQKVRNAIQSAHPEAEPVILSTIGEKPAHAVHGHESHGH
ncbi:MAG: hypothetical protein WCG55_02230 [bacterium]